jgi:hypothetical protein
MNKLKNNVCRSQIKSKRLKVKSMNVKNEKMMKLDLCHLIKKAQPQSIMLKNAYLKKMTKKNTIGVINKVSR